MSYLSRGVTIALAVLAGWGLATGRPAPARTPPTLPASDESFRRERIEALRAILARLDTFLISIDTKAYTFITLQAGLLAFAGAIGAALSRQIVTSLGSLPQPSQGIAKTAVAVCVGAAIVVIFCSVAILSGGTSQFIADHDAETITPDGIERTLRADIHNIKIVLARREKFLNGMYWAIGVEVAATIAVILIPISSHT